MRGKDYGSLPSRKDVTLFSKNGFHARGKAILVATLVDRRMCHYFNVKNR